MLGLTARLVILVGVVWRSGAHRNVTARLRAVPKPRPAWRRRPSVWWLAVRPTMRCRSPARVAPETVRAVAASQHRMVERDRKRPRAWCWRVRVFACHAIARVIYNPIDLGPVPSASEVGAMRAAWGFGAEHVVVGQVASLHRQKGIWLILDLAEKLCAEFPMLRLVLVGDDSADAGEGPQLRAAIGQRGLANRIVLPGYDTRLAAVYAALDVALCLFGGELGGVGRAAYEAAVSGKPLVATVPDPTRSETIENGVSGLLFTHADTAGIADAIRRLVSEPTLRASLGASAQASIGHRHSPAVVADSVLKLYAELAAT